MDANLIAWFEIIFNLTYLLVVWFFVYRMTRSMPSVAPQNRRTASLVRLAFILLAAGDTAHVGFRVVAHLVGGSGAQLRILGTPMSLVGLGTLATSYTVTLFYMLFVYIWQAHNHRKATWFTSLLLAAGVVRLVFMALPGNEWASLVPPQPVSLYRNLPLLLQGGGVCGLILSSAYPARDHTFKWIGWMIAASFAFYIPVILFAQRFPLTGMLMIPKTCAYLVIAWMAYRGLWGPSSSKTEAEPQASPGVSMPA